MAEAAASDDRRRGRPRTTRRRNRRLRAITTGSSRSRAAWVDSRQSATSAMPDRGRESFPQLERPGRFVNRRRKRRRTSASPLVPMMNAPGPLRAAPARGRQDLTLRRACRIPASISVPGARPRRPASPLRNVMLTNPDKGDRASDAHTDRHGAATFCERGRSLE